MLKEYKFITYEEGLEIMKTHSSLEDYARSLSKKHVHVQWVGDPNLPRDTLITIYDITEDELQMWKTIKDRMRIKNNV